MGIFNKKKKKEADEIKPVVTKAGLEKELKRLANKYHDDMKSIEENAVKAIQSAKSVDERTAVKEKRAADLEALEEALSAATSKTRRDFLKQLSAKDKDKYKLK